jgi:hypothetical protein
MMTTEGDPLQSITNVCDGDGIGTVPEVMPSEFVPILIALTVPPVTYIVPGP